MSSIKTRLGEFFRFRLDTDKLHFYLNNSDANSQPPYGVITVYEMMETTPMSCVFRADIRIAIISDIDESNTDEHDVMLTEVLTRLNGIERRVTDTVSNIRLFGFTVMKMEAIVKDEAASFSDVITVIAGCGGCPGDTC